ncbi:hypothetical protein LP416_16945 [Polaromonas sp. P2-4]|nr:hypothetical protein LP416_16945 [Polaromonas sp. P2-4]
MHHGHQAGHANAFSTIALVALAEEADIPKSVLSLVTGSAAMIGEVFCSHLVKNSVSPVPPRSAACCCASAPTW